MPALFGPTFKGLSLLSIGKCKIHNQTAVNSPQSKVILMNLPADLLRGALHAGLLPPSAGMQSAIRARTVEPCMGEGALSLLNLTVITGYSSKIH